MSQLLKPHEIRPVETDFDFDNPPMDPVALSHMLAREVIEHGFFSLAANQIGLQHRFFVIRCNPIIAVFNPILLAEGEDEVTMEEGCASHPGLMLKVPRTKIIRVRYTQPNAEKVTERFSGLTARYFQQAHQMLDNIHFTCLVNRYHLDQAKKKAKKIDKKE